MSFKIVMSNVASYKNSSTFESDKKVTLLYGLNGSGKSTISNYLYAPESPKYKHCSREGFDEAGVFVYNARFVRDNFLEIDKLSGIFTLSKVNKEIETQIAEIIESIKQLEVTRNASIDRKNTVEQSELSIATTAEDAIWKIKTRYSGGDRVLEYCLEGLKSKARLFGHISALPLESESALQTIESIKKDVESLYGDTARTFAEIPHLSPGTTTLEQNSIFSKVIIGKTDSPVAELIAKLSNADWVNQGLNYVDILESENNNTCPFCQANTLTESATTLIRDYFDQSFANDIADLKSAKAHYYHQCSLQPDLSGHYHNPFLANRIAEFKALHNQLLTAWKSNADQIDKKINSPSIPITLEATDPILESLNQIIFEANQSIVSHNKRINDKQASLVKLKEEFWKRCRFDYDSAIQTYDSAMKGLDEQKQNISKEIEQAQSKIVYLKTTLVDLQRQTVNVDATIESINSRLERIGIDSFRITKAGENRYRLSRDGTSPEDFQTLSEGEKTVISFIYFLELCKGKRSPTDTTGKKIVVIDDPISSLSHIYVFHIGQLIKEEFSNSELFAHIIILTHSLYFFYELTDIKKERRDKNQKLLRVIKNSSGSTVIDMKYEEIQNDYQAYWSVIMDEEQHPALIANCMRNVIEYFFNFVSKKDLNNVFQMPALKDAKHHAFCRFMNRESHSLGQNIFDYKEFDYNKFKEGFKLVFHEAGFPEHYATMSG